MPQIWMTYDELGGLLGCGAEEARERVLQEHLDRKKSRDGKTRVKLSLPWIGLFIEQLKTIEPLDQAIQDLRAIHAVMGAHVTQQDAQQRPAGSSLRLGKTSSAA